MILLEWLTRSTPPHTPLRFLEDPNAPETIRGDRLGPVPQSGARR